MANGMTGGNGGSAGGSSGVIEKFKKDAFIQLASILIFSNMDFKAGISDAMMARDAVIKAQTLAGVLGIS